ncbi:MAG TPA: hypothetical protein VK129_05305 [Terriglobales bacterium]|nr:hypothetical protein [Terriglobales bacterium]
MKKLLLVFLLVLTTVVIAQNSGQPANVSGTATASANSKSIQDPAEFAMYDDACHVTDPAQKAAALEAFVARYPNSTARLASLLLALEAYQQIGNQEKLQGTAKHILEIDPNNVTALALDVVLNYMKGEAGDAAAASAAGAEAQRALQALASWQKPEEMPQAEYDAKRKNMTAVFNTAGGFAALQSADYASARGYYLKLIELDPSVVNYRRLGFADLQLNPLDVNGFWYLAKAEAIAQSQNDKASAQQIAADGKDRYRRYHGSSDGWDQIVSAAATQASPAPDFTVKAKPTECEQVVAAAQQTDLETLAVADWELILSHRDCSPEAKPAAEKMWQAIQAKQKNNGVGKLAFPVKVISATADSLQAAITEKNQQANKADLQVALEKPFASPPAPGTEMDVVGMVADYTPQPFLFIMQNGEAQESKPKARPKPAHTGKPGAPHRAHAKSALR